MQQTLAETADKAFILIDLLVAIDRSLNRTLETGMPRPFCTIPDFPVRRTAYITGQLWNAVPYFFTHEKAFFLIFWAIRQK